MIRTKSRNKIAQLRSSLFQFFLIYISLIVSSEFSRLFRVYILQHQVDKTLFFFVHLQIMLLLAVPWSILVFIVFKIARKRIDQSNEYISLIILSTVIYGFLFFTFGGYYNKFISFGNSYLDLFISFIFDGLFCLL